MYNVAICSTLRPEGRALLQLLDDMGIATADRTYAPGDAVYREGEYGDALYVLTSGVLKVFRPYSGSKEATLRLLRPWDIFGHLAFEGEARQRAYVEAVTECEVTKVPKVFVERAIRREPQVAFRLMTLLELRLVQYEELVRCLLPRETEVRLANLLPILAQKFGERSDGVVTIDLRLARPRRDRTPVELARGLPAVVSTLRLTPSLVSSSASRPWRRTARHPKRADKRSPQGLSVLTSGSRR